MPIVHPYAKINLFLSIQYQRSNGYHELVMVNARIGMSDRLRVELTDEPAIELTCNNPDIPLDDRNTAYRAAIGFFDYAHVDKGVKIYIEKHIPAGAGLGGGSSDAAQVLLQLAALIDRDIPLKALERIAEDIGADVPFFLHKGICTCTGIGQKVHRIDYLNEKDKTPLYAVLCSPDIRISTAAAYRLWDEVENPEERSPIELIEAIEGSYWEKIPHLLYNSFEQVIYKNYPNLNTIYHIFSEISPTKPLLTGSGSNLYSLHLTEEEANETADALQSKSLTAGMYPLVFG